MKGHTEAAIETRRTERLVRFPLAVKAELAGDSFTVEELTFNLSVGGVFLLTTVVVPLRTTGRLTFRIERWKQPFSVQVEVVHIVSPNKAGHPPGIGLQFIDFSETDQARLEELISNEVSSMRNSVNEPTADLLAKLRRCSTGEKVTLAASATRPEIDALIREENPVVVHRLLKNPLLGLDGVRRILRSHRTTVAVLSSIAGTARWTADEQIRVLICLHRSTRLEDATTQMNQLPPLRLFELSRNQRIRIEVRNRAKALLQNRYPQWQPPRHMAGKS